MLCYGCGLGASEVVRLRACGIDSEQMIIASPMGPLLGGSRFANEPLA
jgi:hypothetical protein